MICTKGTHQSAKFQTAHVKFHQICTLAPFVESLEGLCLMTLNSDAKFEEKLTCGLENDMRNLANFYQST